MQPLRDDAVAFRARPVNRRWTPHPTGHSGRPNGLDCAPPYAFTLLRFWGAPSLRSGAARTRTDSRKSDRSVGARSLRFVTLWERSTLLIFSGFHESKCATPGPPASGPRARKVSAPYLRVCRTPPSTRPPRAASRPSTPGARCRRFCSNRQFSCARKDSIHAEPRVPRCC